MTGRSPFIRVVVRLIFLAALIPLMIGNTLATETNAANPLGHLKFRALGPAMGGRVLAVAGIPGDSNVYFFGAAAGGVFKSVDGGLTWKPTFEKESVASIGALAVAPSDSNIVWVGTGEACIRGDISFGNGVYKSTDGGLTWKHMGLADTRHIGKLIIDPKNPDIILVAALGHAYGPNEERGVFRTTDGGKTWQKVLYKDDHTGASDVAFDPNNPRILYAGLWQAQRTPWSLSSGGSGSGLYKSTDGGTTWKQLSGHGLPKGILGKIGVAVAPSDSNRVYALMESKEGALWQSEDGGENWHVVNSEHALSQRAWYYTHIVVDPQNADVVYCPQVPLLKSIDGGKTFQAMPQGHGDNHALWIDPQNPKRMINGNDGGVIITTDGGKSWAKSNLPLSQFYHVATDNRTPFYVCGEVQDLGSACGPSRKLDAGRIELSDWYNVGGGESGFAVPDPFDPNTIYANGYDGDITQFDLRTRQARVINVDPEDPMGWPASALKYRFQWTAPILISSHHHNEVYLGGDRLFRTTDGGTTWTAVSPDLTRNDKTKQESSGGPITKDNTSVEYYDTIFALAESPAQAGVLWVGTDDGLIHVTRDGGKTWKNVTPNKSLLPEWGLISIIDASPYDAGMAYVTVDFHKLDNFDPYILKTSDFGATWTRLDSNLPKGSYAHVVREDPVRKGLLYAGTETGLWISFDDGAHWQSFQNNIPTAPVHDLVVQRAANSLVVGTHGRSIYVLDTLTPVQQFTPKVETQDAFLFTPPPAYRHQGGRFYRGPATLVGQNPPNGVVIDFYLKSVPKGEVGLTILDGEGKIIRRYSSEKKKTGETEEDQEAETRDRGRPAAPVVPKEAGLNEFVWDMRHEPPTLIEHGVLWNRGGTVGPTALPGKYTVKLTVDGKDFTAPAELKLDPRVQTPAAELEAQLTLGLTLRDRMSSIANAVNRIHSIQKQIADLSKNLGDDPKVGPIQQTGKELRDKLQAVEERLYQTRLKEVEDVLNYPIRLYNKFSSLSGWVQSADAAPTQSEYEVAERLTAELNSAFDDFDKLIAQDLSAFNRLVREKGIPNILPGESLSKPQQ